MKRSDWIFAVLCAAVIAGYLAQQIGRNRDERAGKAVDVPENVIPAGERRDSLDAGPDLLRIDSVRCTCHPCCPKAGQKGGSPGTEAE